MKAPRYPKYYIPNWVLKEIRIRKASSLSIDQEFLLENTISFIENCVKKLKKYKSIKIWQIGKRAFRH